MTFERRPEGNIRGLAAAGCWGFNFHDDDLVPFGSSAAEAERVLGETRQVMTQEGMSVRMATCNMFEQPVFRDGALTSNDARVRAYARQKAMRAADMGAELGAETFVVWGGREGLEVEASKDPVEAIKRYREGVEFVAGYIAENDLGMRVAMEPKPDEPRGDIFLPTAGHVLGFIATLDPAVEPIVGVNPEIQHSRMAGLNTGHELAQCLEAGKLFHTDLGAQKASRYDQDFRFGAEDLKETFALVGVGASSDAWAQLCADVLELPVRRPTIVEAAARGAALQARWVVDGVTPETDAADGDRFQPAPSQALIDAAERQDSLRRLALQGPL